MDRKTYKKQLAYQRSDQVNFEGCFLTRSPPPSLKIWFCCIMSIS